LRHSAAPSEFWCYAIEWTAKVTSLTAHSLPVLQTRTPEELVTGRTPDILEYAHFSFFEWVWCKEHSAFPEPDVKLAHWIGVAKDVGQAMTWLLTENYTVIARSSDIQLQEYEKTDPIVTKQQEIFMQRVLERERLSSEFDEPFIAV
jgi:hypothetical protein